MKARNATPAPAGYLPPETSRDWKGEQQPNPRNPAAALRSHKPRRNRRRSGILRRALRALVNAFRNL